MPSRLTRRVHPSIAALLLATALLASCAGDDSSSEASPAAGAMEGRADIGQPSSTDGVDSRPAPTTTNVGGQSVDEDPDPQLDTEVETDDSTASGRVQLIDLALEDQSRDEPAISEDRPLREGRRLTTLVHLPAGNSAAPLIVLAHGANGSPSSFGELASAWAEAGYVVALPTFPLSSRDIGSPPFIETIDVQAADVSFVLDELLALSAASALNEPELDTPDDGALMAGRIDSERVALAGLSLGAMTTHKVTFDNCCRDERFSAVAGFAGFYQATDAEVLPTALPTLLIHGDADSVFDVEQSAGLFRRLAGPAWFVTLLDGGHSEPFTDFPSDFDDQVEELTTAFWDYSLRNDDSAIEQMVDIVSDDASMDMATTG